MVVLKHHLLLLTVLLLPVQALLAQGQVAFEQTEHDFGAMTEGDVPTYTFTFKNEGSAPVRLLMVRPSCGCTSPEWTRDPVPPGGTGNITVAYTSEGRPGVFRKNINVFTDGQPEELVLYITGEVRPKPVTGGVALGNLAFEQATADLGELAGGESGIYTFRLQNKGPRPVTIQGVEAASNVSVSYPSTPLASGDIALITVAVDVNGDAGPDFAYPITIRTDDETMPVKSLEVTGRTK